MDFKVKTIENDKEEDRMLNNLFISQVREKYVEIGQEKFVLPIYFNDNWEKINKFEVRDDDVFITGHMKSGTTWVHEIVDLIVYGVNSKDTNTLRTYRQLFLDFPLIYNMKLTSAEFPFFNEITNALYETKNQRCIRTHLPWFLLPEQIRNETKSPKIINVLRNPKDTCISFYYHSISIDGFKGHFEEFCKLFLAGRLHYGPFFTNIKSYWEKKHLPNILFVKYSDLKRDPLEMIKTIATFLEKPLTISEIEILAEHSSLESMKKNFGKQMDELTTKFSQLYGTRAEEVSFVRKGKEGGYKSMMSDELIKAFDAATEKALEGTELSF